MSGLFSNLNGIRKPDVIMNMGPTPREGGLPGRFNGQTNALINYGSTLLGDMAPYEFGEPANLSDQTSYMNIPHKVQKIVPELRLPEARSEGGGVFMLSHAVDDGDVTFVLRLDRNAGTIQKLHSFERMELSQCVDPFVNLATVNYLLAGIQRNWNRPSQVHWHQFMVDVDFAPKLTQARTRFTARHALQFVQEVARPFGIAIGSEKQGGQHEGSASAVTFPVNFVTSLLVSGRFENLINMWREHDVSAGDDLVFHLAWLPIAKEDNSLEYVLNHWGKGLVRQRFDYELRGVDGTEAVNFGWQLVPAVHSMQPPLDMPEGYDWREHGHWHIAKTQVMKAREVTAKLEREGHKIQGCYADDSRFLRGSLLEGTFEPVFVCHRRMPASLGPQGSLPGSFMVGPGGIRVQRRRLTAALAPTASAREAPPPPPEDDARPDGGAAEAAAPGRRRARPGGGGGGRPRRRPALDAPAVADGAADDPAVEV